MSLLPQRETNSFGVIYETALTCRSRETAVISPCRPASLEAFVIP
jgi:hypothetical protein